MVYPVQKFIRNEEGFKEDQDNLIYLEECQIIWTRWYSKFQLSKIVHIFIKI